MKGPDFHNRTREACRDPELARKLQRATKRQFEARMEVCGELGDVDRFRTLAAALRDDVLSRLADHLETFTNQAERRGVKVHWAEDANEGRRIIEGIARDHGARNIVKSKSMLTEEIGLTPHLQEKGREVVETDLGEFIIQLAGQRPSHIVLPAVHMSARDVANLFEEAIDYQGPADAPSLTRAARIHLREKFRTADMGISGVNFALAREGAWAVCTNEGNGRYVTGLPKVYVAVMGIERIVQDLHAAAVILKLLARFATGQRITQYVNFTRGPDPREGPEAVHLVILDNGRSRILAGPYWPMLRCIRCGACLNVCPVFRRIGGQAFPGCYSGPMGSVLLPLQMGLEQAGDTARACSLCRLCEEVCPVRIPLPDLLLDLRADLAEAGLSPLVEKLGMAAGAKILKHPVLYRAAQKTLRWTGAQFGPGPWLRHLPGWLGNWTKAKDFPLPDANPFLSGRTSKKEDRDE